MAHPGVFRGCSRGVFALPSWEPLRKPGQPYSPSNIGRSNGSASAEVPQEVTPKVAQAAPSMNDGPRNGVMEKKEDKAASGEANGNGVKLKKGNPLVAKYSYTANPNSPLGKELSFKQKDKLRFVAPGPQAEWWLIENWDKEQGYAPSSYMMVIEMNGLPWLEGRAKEEEPEPVKSGGSNMFGLPPAGVSRPYKPSYDHPELKGKQKEAEVSKWRCDICDKTLNGPQPYSAHMNSKIHKENVEYAREEGLL